MSGPITEGTWPHDDMRRAFVSGAKWWHWYKDGWTMFPAEREIAEHEAEKRYPGGKPTVTVEVEDEKRV